MHFEPLGQSTLSPLSRDPDGGMAHVWEPRMDRFSRAQASQLFTWVKCPQCGYAHRRDSKHVCEKATQ